mmetsp:Transcript_29937/g.85929  ORF Transcript_29937/g.85929 Transcript_29937/m.85929 type:complete len:147 (-) Transcript_29937:94-534(-)
MKPAWDKLGATYAGSTSVVVADVDCTAGGKDVCSEQGVEGYPTIKYFTAETGKKGEKYQGGRTFDDLDKFVKEKLARKCDTKTKEDCDDKEKAYIDKMSKKDAAAQAKELARLKGVQGGDMKEDIKVWLMKRIRLLEDMSGAKSEL